jgi:uncharacterized BrkB/YihY/UPF0761 family membrane protein
MLPGLATILHVVHLTLSFAFTTILFAMIFKILPDKPVVWEEGLAPLWRPCCSLSASI